jgi:hypothetical protein
MVGEKNMLGMSAHFIWRKRLLEQWCRNMVGEKGCWNRGVGSFKLAEKVAGTEVSEYGGGIRLLEQGCLNKVGVKR